jgi:hypothetical protein
MLGEVDGELFPGWEGFATKFTWLILWSTCSFMVAFLYHEQHGIYDASFIDGGFGFLLWLDIRQR